MSVYYHQLNVCDIESELNKIKEISKNKKNVLIGLEVTIQDISEKLHLNIDPQHSWKEDESRITCLERFTTLLPKIGNISNKDLHMFFLKPDLDSISTAAVFDIYQTNPTWIFQEDINRRIQAIIEYDRHGRENIILEDHVKIPRGLFMYVSGWKNSIADKINTTKNWILEGTFENIYKYNRIADKKLKQSMLNSKIEIIIPKKIVFIRSINRGACGLGYKYAPIIVALNPSYRYGIDDTRVYGKKWIIAQQHDGYLNMEGVLDDISKLESGWGGSPTIIGSPQEKPSKLGKEEIIEIVSQKILVH